jgi:hypothetical protein
MKIETDTNDNIYRDFQSETFKADVIVFIGYIMLYLL